MALTGEARTKQTPALYPDDADLRERLKGDNLAPRAVGPRPVCRAEEGCGHQDAWHHQMRDEPRGKCQVKGCRCPKYRGEVWPTRHAFPYARAEKRPDGGFAFPPKPTEAPANGQRTRARAAGTRSPAPRCGPSKAPANPAMKMKPWTFRPCTEREGR